MDQFVEVDELDGLVSINLATLEILNLNRALPGASHILEPELIVTELLHFAVCGKFVLQQLVIEIPRLLSGHIVNIRISHLEWDDLLALTICPNLQAFLEDLDEIPLLLHEVVL